MNASELYGEIREQVRNLFPADKLAEFDRTVEEGGLGFSNSKSQRHYLLALVSAESSSRQKSPSQPQTLVRDVPSSCHEFKSKLHDVHQRHLNLA